MNSELITYLIIFILLNIGLRFISGFKNAVFYAKGNHEIHNFLRPFVRNLHKLQTPHYYIHVGSIFFAVMAISRGMGKPVLDAIGASILIAMGTSGIAGPLYQGPINLSEGKKFVNSDENKKAEFALQIGGFSFSFWYPRPWYGVYRVYFALFWVVILGITISML